MKRTLEADRAAAELSMAVVGYACAVDVAAIASANRGAAHVAFARQVSMYLTHVAFELSLSRVALAFGRDRSTVGYACHLVEDRRDDPTFDQWLAQLESLLRHAPRRELGRLAA